MLIPVIIYIVSLSLLYLTSMQGFYLVGSDIHSEYYIASRMYNGWDITYPHLYNASVSTTLIAPWISKFLSIDLITVFKMIYPALFALVPVLLYFIYRSQTDSKRSLFAVLFFITVPVFFMEMPQLPRQELAEIFLCLTMLIMVNKLEYKSYLLVPCAAITIMLHYSIGIVTIALLLGMFIVKAINSKLHWQLIGKSMVSYYGIIITLTVTATLAAIWGLNVANGMPLHSLTNIFSVGHVASPVSAVLNSVTIPVDIQVVQKSDGIIAVATGLDIFSNEISVWGNGFRIIQWITQLLIVLGCFRIVLIAIIMPNANTITGIIPAILLEVLDWTLL